MELNDLDRQRLYRSSLIGLCFWTVLFLALTLIPFRAAVPESRIFPPVHLTLSVSPAQSAPAASSGVETNAAVEPAAKAEPAQPAAKPTAKSATTKKATVSAAPKKASPKAASAQSATAKTASAGLGIPNFSAPLTSSNQNSGISETLDFSSTTETAKPKVAGLASSSVSEFEGTAARLQNPDGGVAQATGKKNGTQRAPAGSETAESADTSKALSQIAGTARTGTVAATGSAGSTGAATGTSGTVGSTAPTGKTGATGRTSTVSGLDFEGTPRKLISPAEPSITLPANLARLVDSNRSVTVQFTVRPDGSVPGSLVYFTPSAILPAEIRDFLKSEFSRWRFEESDHDGQVRFLYSIRVE